MREDLLEKLRKRWPNFSGEVIGIKYLRASQDALGRAISVRSQEDEGDEFFDEHGIVNGGTFYDNNLSASLYATQTRQNYERALEELKSGRVHLLWTFDSSRAQRDLEVYVKLRRICIETGALWAYGGRIYDMSDPADRKATARDAVEAEGASDTSSTHVRRGVRKRARSGKHAGPTPYGYRRQFDPDTGESLGLVIDPDHAKVMREMVDRVMASEPLTTIAKDLNRRGVPSPRGHLWNADRVNKIVTEYAVPHEWMRFLARLDPESAELAERIAIRVEQGESPTEIGRELNREGVPWILPAPWSGSQVRMMVLSDIAAGIRMHQGKPMMVKVPDGQGGFTMKLVDPQWEPIITMDEHTVLKARLGDPSRKPVRDGSRVRHLWVGIARCGICQNRMIAERVDTKGAAMRCATGHVRRPKDKLEAWLTEQAMQLLERKDATRIFKIKDSVVRSQAAQDDAKVLRAELEGWRQDAIAGKVTRESFATIEAGLIERIKTAEGKAERAALPPVLVDVVGPQAREAFAALSLPQQREVLRAIMRPRVYHQKERGRTDLETETIDPGFLHVPATAGRSGEGTSE
ncbi:recombinase family protein [Actinokineospora iranica]|uniref:Site-specific DNA recombinase n=1 Tax=Actinokineospora iranica TaxID=1271860 RepID=A0A1G6K542_9PSEU|nr:recombinase family protein [Actinokineospora iranica]SDC26043.1 Site-specific DNA recombinase [Actinokineospora iranica]